MDPAGASIRSERRDGGVSLSVSGRLDAQGLAAVWDPAIAAAKGARSIEAEVSGLTYCDIAGTGLFLELDRRMREAGGQFRLTGLKDEFRTLLGMFEVERYDEEVEARRRRNPLYDLGKATIETLKDIRFQIGFLGETTLNLVRILLRPARLRWRDFMHVLDGAGVDGVPLCAILGFLVGLILAFQCANPMKTYGAELYVSDLVAIIMIRELGPLLTAIIMAGRSGSAFAAEIGTMKVNEEIDALTTMGIPPVQFLVVPRMLAGIIVAPILTMWTNLLGLVGGAIVVTSFGYPLVAYTNRVVEAISLMDLASGLFKTLFFGAIIAGIGCLRGLQTGAGALSVGVSTTRSVVAGIIIVIGADMVFAVVFYMLGI